MARSSGLPRRPGLAGITRIIRTRASTTTVSRPVTSKDSLDQTTTTLNDHTEELWLFEPRESVAEELAGERVNGGLGGLAAADGSVDLQRDDRVTFGGVEYEVDGVIPRPGGDVWGDGTWGTGVWSDIEITFWLVRFTRRHD